MIVIVSSIGLKTYPLKHSWLGLQYQYSALITPQIKVPLLHYWRYHAKPVIIMVYKLSSSVGHRLLFAVAPKTMKASNWERGFQVTVNLILIISVSEGCGFVRILPSCSRTQTRAIAWSILFCGSLEPKLTNNLNLLCMEMRLFLDRLQLLRGTLLPNTVYAYICIYIMHIYCTCIQHSIHIS